MMRFIEHLDEIPLRTRAAERSEPGSAAEASREGLRFHAPEPLGPGQELVLELPLAQPSLEARVRVVWCRSDAGGYQVGVAFLDAEDADRARILEQAWRIRRHRRELEARVGHRLDRQKVALDWIARHADEF